MNVRFPIRNGSNTANSCFSLPMWKFKSKLQLAKGDASMKPITPGKAIGLGIYRGVAIWPAHSPRAKIIESGFKLQLTNRRPPPCKAGSATLTIRYGGAPSRRAFRSFSSTCSVVFPCLPSDEAVLRHLKRASTPVFSLIRAVVAARGQSILSTVYPAQAPPHSNLRHQVRA